MQGKWAGSQERGLLLEPWAVCPPAPLADWQQTAPEHLVSAKLCVHCWHTAMYLTGRVLLARPDPPEGAVFSSVQGKVGSSWPGCPHWAQMPCRRSAVVSRRQAACCREQSLQPLSHPQGWGPPLQTPWPPGLKCPKASSGEACPPVCQQGQQLALPVLAPPSGTCNPKPEPGTRGEAGYRFGEKAERGRRMGARSQEGSLEEGAAHLVSLCSSSLSSWTPSQLSFSGAPCPLFLPSWLPPPSGASLCLSPILPPCLRLFLPKRPFPSVRLSACLSPCLTVLLPVPPPPHFPVSDRAARRG